MESVIRYQILSFLLRNKVISPSQFGFLPGRSVEAQLLECVNDWSSCLDKNKPVYCIYFDLKKAFESVSHIKLLEKLKSYHISGPLLEWITSFLSNRKQRVNVNSSFSEWARVTSGVPQGSVLGPLLFLIFVNDIPLVIKHCIIKMYADDIKIYPRLGVTDCKLIQEDINEIVKYCDAHQLTINLKKCIVFRLGQNNNLFEYYINGGVITSSTEVTDLGVIMDSNLNFSSQCANVYSKARRICGLILNSFCTRDSTVLMTAFNTYVLPILLYCSTIWSPRLEKDKTLIEKCLKSFSSKFIVPPMAPLTYEQRLVKFNLLSLNQRRLIRDLCMTHNIMHGNSCLNSSNFFVISSNGKTKNSSVGLRLINQKFSTETRHNFLSFRIINLWNKLPPDLIQTKYNIFKALIKSFILSND